MSKSKYAFYEYVRNHPEVKEEYLSMTLKKFCSYYEISTHTAQNALGRKNTNDRGDRGVAKERKFKKPALEFTPLPKQDLSSPAYYWHEEEGDKVRWGESFPNSFVTKKSYGRE